MKNAALIALLMLSANAFAKKGPLPHERTDTPKLKNSTTGRYLYLGDVPKFDGSELEIIISKMALTTRVTAYVNQGRIDTYANQLFLRWKAVKDAVSDPVFSFHPLIKISKLAEGQPSNVQAWAKIAEQYSSHVLESTGLDIYGEKRNARNYVSNEQEDNYKNNIVEAYFRHLFKTSESSEAVINDNQKLADLLSVENSRKLFIQNVGTNFTLDNSKPGYVGFLTYVYPVAATVKGPFDQPKEQIVTMKTAESIEARWWSDKWNDEFGGYPFLLIEYSGVAFHGPITTYLPMDVWFLRRGYVSHGCHRMDASDVQEFRTLMPTDLKKAQSKIKITILDHFDVADINKDGKLEAVDVKYYSIPSSIAIPKGKTIDDVVAPYLVKNQQGKYFQNNQYAAKFYDAAKDKLKNIPKYEIGAKTVVKKGVHAEVDIMRFEYRPNRIIQYVEEGIKQQGYDDVAGKYPPKYFQRY